MARLKFDRSINFVLKDQEKMSVPYDEVWKGMLVISDDMSINEHLVAGPQKENFKTGIPFSCIIGGGATLKATYVVIFTGIAFKTTEEV